ncbi:MAG: glycosyltransferase family 4 protein [Chloroflexi bacterium]|nr:glycosyltransferase family 4 protein [Chloroflexota bacterium]
MNICLDASPTLQPISGIARYTTKLIEGLLKLDSGDNLSLLYNRGLQGSPPAPLNHLPKRVIPLGNKQWRLLLLLAYRLGSTMDGLLGDTDLFHGTDYLLPPLRRINAVVTIHDLSFLLFPSCHTLGNRLNLRMMVPLAVRSAGAIIVDSQSSKRDLLRWIAMPEEKIHVIHLGVDDCYFVNRTDEERQRLLQRYAIQQPFILSVGTIEPRKNIPALLDAYSALHGTGNLSHQLVIVGRAGWHHRSVLQQLTVDRATSIRFLGHLPDEELAILYTAADLFVFPSLYEGFGLPPLESMACGTPVVCSNTSSLPEVVGEAALTVDPHDVASLARAMDQVFTDSDLRRRLAGQGRERAKMFTWQKTARCTLDVYRHVQLNRR